VITPEQIADEEYRAALWREQVRRRQEFQLDLWNALGGDPARRAALQAAYEPLLAWALEQQMPELDPEDDPEVDPLGISDTVNVGL
jgi:hypothetical protein